MSGMVAYFTRRLLLVPFTFIAITLMVYSVLRVVPGGPIEQAEIAMKLGAMQGEAAGGSSGDPLGNDSELQLDEESLLALQRYYSLDRPVIIGYLQWLGAWPREDRTRVPVSTLKKHPDIFNPLRQLKRAQTDARRSLTDLLDPVNILYRDGSFYSRLPVTLNDIDSSSDLPETVTRRLIQLQQDGFASRSDHLTWLAQNGYTTEGNFVYHQIEDKSHPELKRLYPEVETALGTMDLTAIKLADIREKYGYLVEDKGKIYYVKDTFSGILQLNFGRSYTHGKPVISLIVSKMEISIQFGLTGYILTWLVCIPLGVFKALKHKSLFDTGTSFIVFLGYAMPGFIVCLVLISTVAVNVDWIPLGGYKPDNIDEMAFFEAILGRFRHMLIPIIGYMVGSFASMTILMKNSLLDNLGADYVRTGFAKGLSERRVVFLHALRNSLIPITAGIGHAISLLFAGSFLIEKTCNIDGMGLLGYEAIIQRDYPIILATLVIGVLIRLFGNIFSDIVWAMIDPRIRFG